ncbi:phage terminase large subunit [Candidatus Marimicrobium litorale]|uniref:Terminase large subunit gp17-like C-terminal domain-containing protein n=1 Tax=Candidatus Marimicrobium litorale TaxID=2518991 RepID=A0ABT3T3F3_9GAMM|nr:phage terminase large subunit [Candidatus Marimicrobium litorale]MCX2976366.1 hypothetical protein [Candidatus Marimicrobium litorale]
MTLPLPDGLTPEDLRLLERYQDMQRALNDFQFFVEDWMRPTGHPDFAFDWQAHHKVIGQTLQDVADGRQKRVIISVSPGAAKTTLHVQFRAWMAARNPDHQNIAVAATQALAESIGRRVRSALQTKEWQLLSNTGIHQDQQSVASFGYGNGGVQNAFGLGAKLIGRRGHLILVDDYVGSYEDVATESQREKAWEWFRGALMSRLIPDSPLVVIGTRWDQDDIIGKILASHEAGDWTHIRMPMEADSPDDPLGRAAGERLWANYYSQDEIDSYKLDVKNWHCMWQCRPLLDEQEWLPLENLPVIDQRPAGLTSTFAGVDIALTEGDGDYTVILVGALTPDRRLVLLDCIRKRISPDKIIEELVQVHQAYKITEFLMDDDNASKTLMSLANEMLRRRGIFLPFRKMPMHGQNKEVRAAPFKGLALQDGVRLLRGHWNEALLHEASQFPRQATGIHDDIIDAAGLLAKRISVMSSGEIPAQEKQATPIEGAVRMQDGQMVLTETLEELFSERERNLSASRSFGRI